MKKWVLNFNFLLWFGLAFLTACGLGKPEIIKVDPAYGKYVSGYTSGMVSKKSNISVELAPELIKEIDLSDQKLLNSLFEIEPAIEGNVVLVGERTIEFVPNDTLPSNQFYDVYFDLEKVSKVDQGYESFHFQFATYQQKITVESEGLIDPWEDGMTYKRFRGSITTSDVEDTSNLRKILHARQDGKELPFYFDEYDYDENDHQHYFYVDVVERKTSDSKFEISWDGQAIGSFSKGSFTEDVPKIGDFNVTSADVKDELDQWLELYFSEPISPEQDLTGLIELQGEKPTISIEGNTVKLYLKERIIGTRKLIVHRGVENAAGHKMLNSFDQFVTFEAPKPNVKIEGNGNILPNSQGLIFPFQSIGLKSVEVRIMRIMEHNVHYFLQVNDLNGSDELTRFGKVLVKKRIFLNKQEGYNPTVWMHNVLDISKYITPEPGAIYRVSIKFTIQDSDCGCSETDLAEHTQKEEENKDTWNEDDWNTWGFNDGFDTWEYYFNGNESPCSAGYYYGKAISRNILASDLGVVFKLDENKKGHVFVSNMLNTDPVKNAKIEFYTYARSLIGTTTTNENGMAEIQLSEKPFLLVAKMGEQRGYLKLGDGYANSLSRFDVDGETNPEGIRGYIYGERGVWRPGDSLYIHFMLGDPLHKLPANHPVQFELQDPFGQMVYSVTKTQHVNGIYDFRTATDREAVTGNYTAITTVGNKKYYKTLKIETIKPNRLKILFETATNGSSDSSAYLFARWLHGATAHKLKANITVSLNDTKTKFESYKNFIFDSPLRHFRAETETMFDGSLNDKGEAHPRMDLHLGEDAPGKLMANYVVKVFEESGDFSIDRFQQEYSPFRTYIGIKAPTTKEYDATLETGKNHHFEVVSVNTNGKAVACEKIQIRIYKLKWRWWYEHGEEDLFSYVSRSGSALIKDTLVSTEKGKTGFNFRINYPDYGRYLITATDLKGQHQTGEVIYMDWPYWERGSRSENEDAKMMNFSTDKQVYLKGEKIKVRFPSPQNGRALVSIENSRKVLEKFWVATVAGETTCEFTATAEMAPSCYVHVTMIQPHSQTKNDLPIRMYGIVPIRVDDPLTHVQPVIACADVFQPESTASIHVKEKNGRKMTYTLAIVDDGLLDLTRFKTPDPWPTFYPKEALGVKTWDMYDEVIGAYSGKLNNLLGIGGDGEEDFGSGSKANRFKPMVRVLGPFTLEAGKEKTHKIDIPNYVGSVRVMVVAHDNDGAYGNDEKTVFVRKPLMLLTTMPRVLGPGEEVDIPVTVFAMENHVRKVNVELEANDLFEVVGANKQSVTFTENGDQLVYFHVKIKKRVGLGKITVKASSGKEKADESIEIDVRPSNPKIIETQTHTLEAGKSLRLPIELIGMQGTNKITLEMSTIPGIALEKRLGYLISYPHGCVEQTTSGAFPQLYLSSLMDLNEKQEKEITTNVKAAIDRLRKFQTASGGFSYWPGENYENEWASSYAGHFLLEADAAGYKLPDGMKDRWVKYQQQKAQNWVNGAFNGRAESDQLNQAYRLYTLALAGKAELGAMNRMRESEGLNNMAAWRLATAYSLAGQTNVAKKMVYHRSFASSSYRELSGTFGTDFRDKCMVLESMSLMGETAKKEELLSEIASELRSEQWMSTQETAYALLAVSTATGTKNQTGKVNLSCKLENEAVTELILSKKMMKIDWKGSILSKNKFVSLKNNSKQKVYVSFTTEGIPMESNKKSKHAGMNMEVSYFNADGNALQPEKIKLGTEFTVEINVKNLDGKTTFREIALSSVFPVGWEISNTRLDEQSNTGDIRYQDFRDDRVNSYFDLGPKQEKSIRVHCIATYCGKFYLPSMFVSTMYNEQISAQLPGKWVQVLRE